jgi:hypothetical protein
MSERLGERMSDGLRWLPESFPEGFSVTFCEGLSGLEVLERMGADPECVLSLTRDQAEILEMCNRSTESVALDPFDLDEEELRHCGFLERDIEVVRAGEIEGWAFTIQSFGAYSTTARRAKNASRGTRFVSFTRTVNTASWMRYAVDGVLVQSFDPLHPKSGDAGGVAFPGLGGAADPGMRVLEVLEEALGLRAPQSLDFDPLLSASLTRD